MYKNFFKNWTYILLPVLALTLVFSGCGDDDDDPMTGGDAAIASFQFEIDANDFLTVNFSNFSDNADSFAWDFGDGNTSTEREPSHTYAEAGTYNVVLTASSANGSAERSETITITDPNAAQRILSGQSGKTWRLWREGISMSVGPNADDPGGFWPGLSNDGSRPCLYSQEFTFNPDGSYVFDDMGEFWAEFGVFNNQGCGVSPTPESCFEATPANMVNECGDDVSAWLSGTHAYEFDPSTGSLTINGMGAWIGIPKLGTTGETIVPTSTTTAQVSFTENAGFDVMLIEFIYDGVYWPIRYASYSDASLEPELVTVAAPPVPFGEDFPDASPSRLFIDFAEPGSIDTIQSASTVDFGVADPTGSGELVGQFNRPDIQFQELQFQTAPEKNDINFENLTTVSVDVYFPSTNDYSGTLTTNVIIGLADRSQTEQWWTDHQQYEWDGSNAPLDEWVTISFSLDMPSTVLNMDNGNTPFERNDYDMIFLQIGDGAHTDSGTFFVRNFVFE